MKKTPSEPSFVGSCRVVSCGRAGAGQGQRRRRGEAREIEEASKASTHD